MKIASSFLIRLYRHSKGGFVLALLFVFVYAFLLIKRMDMTLFPYNAMFAYNRMRTDMGFTYQVKADGKPIRFTNFPYWKKDLLETTAFVYARYVSSGHRVYLEQYLRSKPALFASGLAPALYPEMPSSTSWYNWYAGFAGVPAGQEYSLWQFQLVQTNQGIQVVDSLCLDVQKLTR